MILAQALGEYGGAAALWDSLTIVRIRIADVFADWEPIHFALAGAAAFALWLVVGRRR
jgi:hypothetical protein